MPQVTSSLKTSGSTWTPSDVMKRWGSSYSRLSPQNPAFNIGRINNRGHLEFQKDKDQQTIVTKFQLGDYVVGKDYHDNNKTIRGKIVSLQNGKRVRIDVATVKKLAESSINSFAEFNRLLESNQ